MAVLFFKTAGFNRSPTPPFLSIAGDGRFSEAFAQAYSAISG